MEESKPGDKSVQLPFQNLFLAAGLVSGANKFWMYLGTVLLTITGYLAFQLIIGYPLLNRLLQNGYSLGEVESQPKLLFNSEALAMDRNLILGLELGMFVFAFLGFWAGIHWLHGKRLRDVFTGYEHFRFSRFGLAFLTWTLLLDLSFLVSYG